MGILYHLPTLVGNNIFNRNMFLLVTRSLYQGYKRSITSRSGCKGLAPEQLTLLLYEVSKNGGGIKRIVVYWDLYPLFLILPYGDDTVNLGPRGRRRSRCRKRRRRRRCLCLSSVESFLEWDFGKCTPQIRTLLY